MCTLLGRYGINPALIEPSFLDHIDRRGRDRFALASISPANERLRMFDKSVFITEASNIVTKTFLAVGRAIPATERHSVSLEDTQPFENDEWIVSHNGIIANDNELEREYKLNRRSKVDTAILPPLLSKMGGDVVKVTSLLKGSFALALYDKIKDELWLCTNFMPLYTNEDYSIEVRWSSLPIPGYTTKEVEPYTILHFKKKNDKDPLLNKITVEEYRMPNTLDTNKVTVVCSGGMDSVTALRLYQVLGYDVTLLHFKYGQAAEKVEDYVTHKLSEMFGIPRIVLDVKSIFKHMRSVLTNCKKMTNSSARLFDAESTFSYVKARNLIFASIAFGLTEEIGGGKVVVSANLDDATYPDNGVPFFYKLNEVAKVALNWNSQMEFKAPFIHLTKKELIEIGITIGVPYQWTASCYYPKLDRQKYIVYCGTCGCDKLREESFRALGYVDPVKYAVKKDWGNCIPLTENSLWMSRCGSKELRLSLQEIPYAKFLEL